MYHDRVMANQTIWDPLRKKEVSLTPEEKVRQWFIGVLYSIMEVPMHLMMSEAAVRFGKKQFRTDILVYDRKGRPLAVVECKRPDVELDGSVLEQAVRYNMVLDVKYIIITNGNRTYICRKGGEFLQELPTYESMLNESSGK